jgi:hypothetical protein
MRNIRESVVAAAAASVVLSATLLAQDGIKDTERFIKSGNDMSAAVADGRLSAKGALDAYNVLVLGNTGNMKGDYKKLVNAESAMNRKVADARRIVGEMDKQSAAYFTARSAALAQIQDAALRELAKGRLDASQKEYEAIKAQLREASEALAPFTKNLSDQIRYLGAELTPAAADSLRAQSETLNTKGSDVFAQVDAAVGSANQYFNALRPEYRPAPPPADTQADAR